MASLLWYDSTTSQSRKHLRHAIWQLNSTLPGDGENPVLAVESEWVQLNPAAEVWLDTAQFSEAYDQVHGRQGSALDAQDAQTLRQAVALYKADLLENCQQNWCIFERERFQNMYLIMLEKLMGYCERNRQYEAGIDYGRSILYYDRARERTYRHLMRLSYLAGDRTGAIRLYHTCSQVLQEELEVAPSERTDRLYQRIRADRPLVVPPIPSAFHDPRQPDEASSLAEILVHLKACQTTLNGFQRHLQDDIELIEQSLRS